MSADQVANQLASDTIVSMATYALVQGCTFGAPGVGQPTIAERLTDSATTVIAADCTEVCVENVTVTSSNG